MCWTFKKKSPCANCPYRVDAPLKLWHHAEFKKLLAGEKEQFGFVWGCHKKDGHVCVGYLMMQNKNNFPNINMRLELIKANVDRTYLDALNCKSEMFDTVEQMVKANYPNLLNKKL